MTAIGAERETSHGVSVVAGASLAKLAAFFALSAALTAMASLATWLIAGGMLAIACTALVIIYVAILAVLPPSVLMPIYGARTLPTTAGNQISHIVADFALNRAGFPRVPQLYVLPSLLVSAFALGTPAGSGIAVSEGLLRKLTLRETAGVIAHEVAHIASGDARLFAFSDAVTRLAQVLGLVGTALAVGNVVGGILDEALVPWSAVILLVGTPAVVSRLQMALSHAREFEADATAVRLTGDALGLAGAIRSMTQGSGRVIEDFLPPAFARKVPQPSLLRAHPDGEARITRLLQVEAAGNALRSPLVIAEAPMVLHAGFGPGAMRARYRWPGVWW